ncbi:hypothetical protein Tco_1561920 [Tanacetum coccineum]
MGATPRSATWKQRSEASARPTTDGEEYHRGKGGFRIEEIRESAGVRIETRRTRGGRAIGSLGYMPLWGRQHWVRRNGRPHVKGWTNLLEVDGKVMTDKEVALDVGGREKDGVCAGKAQVANVLVLGTELILKQERCGLRGKLCGIAGIVHMRMFALACGAAAFSGTDVKRGIRTGSTLHHRVLRERGVGTGSTEKARARSSGVVWREKVRSERFWRCRASVQRVGASSGKHKREQENDGLMWDTRGRGVQLLWLAIGLWARRGLRQRTESIHSHSGVAKRMLYGIRVARGLVCREKFEVYSGMIDKWVGVKVRSDLQILRRGVSTGWSKEGKEIKPASAHEGGAAAGERGTDYEWRMTLGDTWIGRAELERPFQYWSAEMDLQIFWRHSGVCMHQDRKIRLANEVGYGPERRGCWQGYGLYYFSSESRSTRCGYGGGGVDATATVQNWEIDRSALCNVSRRDILYDAKSGGAGEKRHRGRVLTLQAPHKPISTAQLRVISRGTMGRRAAGGSKGSTNRRSEGTESAGGRASNHRVESEGEMEVAAVKRETRERK